MKVQNQREYYRLSYPLSYRPSLMIDIDNYEIEDISEYGLKVKVNKDPAFMVEDSVMAIITFPDGKEFDLNGHVIHIDRGFAGLHLETPFPLSLIRSEHLFIINNYSN